MDEQLKTVLNKVEKRFKPISVFLYGSRARVDFLDKSDYEIGVLYSRNNRISRTELKKINPEESINLYPFEYEDFINYKLDTPFPETIYFRELILGGKTILGKKVVENLKSPPIKILDLLQRVSFDIGFALAAVLSHRQGDFITARLEFTKSCLFGIRCLIILQLKEFSLTYDEIYKASSRLNLEKEYNDVIGHAVNVRKGAEIEEQSLYKNISLLNKAVKNKIVESFESDGNIVIL